MPRIKRWFPVSHDINHSPFMRDLARQFGLAGWRVWFEILSIADRNSGEVDLASDGAVSRLATAAETQRPIVKRVIEHLKSCQTVAKEFEKSSNSFATLSQNSCIFRIVKYWEYHRTEERIPPLPDQTGPSSSSIEHSTTTEQKRVIVSENGNHAPKNGASRPRSKQPVVKPEAEPINGMVVSPFVEFRDYYCQLFEDHFHEKYVFEGGKDGKIVHDLVAHRSIEKLRKLAVAFFESTDKFILGSGYTLGVFKSQVHKLLIGPQSAQNRMTERILNSGRKP